MANKLTDDLRDLGLYYTSENLDDIVARAQKNRQSPVQMLEHLVKKELAERSQRSVQRRLRRARIGAFKTMADFDWNWPDTIDSNLVERALQLDFLEPVGNVVLAAAQGLGKTMIAKNIAYQAVLAGHAVRFATASELLLDLAAQDSPRALDRRIKYWSSIKVLVLDEIGYLSFDNRNADLLFQVVSRRYESKSLIITTNLEFKLWPTIFPNAACTTALIDRIVHHSLIIYMEGESYRLRDADPKAKVTRKKSRTRTRTR
jgi:DNA replication protein DnaC